VSDLDRSPSTAESATPPPPAATTSVRQRMSLAKLYRGLPTSVKLILAGIILLSVFFAFVCILWWAERHLLPPFAAASVPIAPTRPHFWIQVFAGKWVPNSIPYASTSFPFALSAVLAIVLNLGPFGATITLIYLYLIRPVVRLGKEQTMKLQQYNNQRDQVIIGEIYSLLPVEQREAMMKIVEQGFAQGSKAMDNEFLEIPYSERGAREFVRRLHEIDVT
jgi:hypothetical protein